MECVFMLFPGVANRSECTSDYSVLLAVAIQLNVSTVLYIPLKKNMLFHMWLVLVIVYIANFHVWSKSMAIFQGYGEFRKCWLMHRSRSLGEGP